MGIENCLPVAHRVVRALRRRLGPLQEAGLDFLLEPMAVALAQLRAACVPGMAQSERGESPRAK